MSQRKTVNKVVQPKLPNENWTVRISFDSRQFFVRFPKELAELLKIKKGQKAKLSIDLLKKDERNVIMRFLDE